MANSAQQNRLTATEQEIMEVFWRCGDGLPFQELLDRMNREYHKDWKHQTLRTFLTGLQRVGLVAARGSRKAQIYYPLCTRDEYMHQWTRSLMERSYSNSLRNFLFAFAGNEPLTEEEVDSLREMLDRADKQRKTKK